MKNSNSVSALLAISFVLSTPAAFAAASIGRCESAFVTSGKIQEARLTRRLNESRASVERDAIRANRKASVDVTLLQSVVLEGQPESRGIRRVAIPLKGENKPVLLREEKNGPLFTPSGKGVIYAGRRYIEFPNSTLIPVDVNGERRLWMFTRGVRPYNVGINRTNGEISPRGYVSDVLMFEIKNNEAHFHSLFLASAPETKFLFEDPRAVDPRYQKNQDGTTSMTFKLAGTDYSPHKDPKDNPDNNPDVMNRYIDIKVGADGVPIAPKVNPDTKTPEFKDLSPAPMKKATGGYLVVDAKNATVTPNRAGEVVVHTRLRPDFSDPDLVAIFDGKPYQYALQSFVFKNEAERLQYNWADALLDLTGKATPANTAGKIRPVSAQELVRDTELPEHLEVPKGRTDLKIKVGVKGIGNGTRPLLTRRVGDLLMTTDIAGGGEYITGVISAKERDSFPMKDGEDAPIRFDHEIRKVQQQTETGVFTRRHYTMSFTVFNGRMDAITDYLPDVIQPKFEHELGKDSGILDLLHVYPMGVALMPKTATARILPVASHIHEVLGKVRAERGEAEYQRWLAKTVQHYGVAVAKVSGGSSDANTDLYDADIKVMLGEAKEFTARAGGVFKKPTN